MSVCAKILLFIVPLVSSGKCAVTLKLATYSHPSQYRRAWDWQKTGGIPKTVVLGVM